MLKKFLLAVLVFLTVLPKGTALAENWVNILSTNGQRHYLDGNTFQYDKLIRFVKCWTKYDHGSKSVVNYKFINLNTRSVVDKMEIVYENGVVVNDFNVPYTSLEYEPVIPGTIGEATYEVIEGITKLEDKNVEWEFYNADIPEPLPLNSPLWEKMLLDDNENLYWALSLMTYSNDVSYCWFKIVGDQGTTIQYQATDLKKNRTAIMQEIDFDSADVAFCKRTYPVLVWAYDNDDLSKLRDGVAVKEYL